MFLCHSKRNTLGWSSRKKKHKHPKEHPSSKQGLQNPLAGTSSNMPLLVAVCILIVLILAGGYPATGSSTCSPSSPPPRLWLGIHAQMNVIAPKIHTPHVWSHCTGSEECALSRLALNKLHPENHMKRWVWSPGWGLMRIRHGQTLWALIWALKEYALREGGWSSRTLIWMPQRLPFFHKSLSQVLPQHSRGPLLVSLSKSRQIV